MLQFTFYISHFEFHTLHFTCHISHLVYHIQHWGFILASKAYIYNQSARVMDTLGIFVETDLSWITLFLLFREPDCWTTLKEWNDLADNLMKVTECVWRQVRVNPTVMLIQTRTSIKFVHHKALLVFITGHTIICPSFFKFHVSLLNLTFHILYFAVCISYPTCHISHLTYCVSHFMYHISQLAFPMSRLTFHFSHFILHLTPFHSSYQPHRFTSAIWTNDYNK